MTTDNMRTLIALLENIDGLPSPEDVDANTKKKAITKFIRRTTWPNIIKDVGDSYKVKNATDCRLMFSLPKDVLAYEKLPSEWRDSLKHFDLHYYCIHNNDGVCEIKLTWENKYREVHRFLSYSQLKYAFETLCTRFLRSSLSNYLGKSLPETDALDGNWVKSPQIVTFHFDNPLCYNVAKELDLLFKEKLQTLLPLIDDNAEFPLIIQKIQSNLTGVG